MGYILLGPLMGRGFAWCSPLSLVDPSEKGRDWEALQNCLGPLQTQDPTC